MSIKAIIYCDNKTAEQTPDFDRYHSRFLHTLTFDKRNLSKNQSSRSSIDQPISETGFLLIAVDGASDILYSNNVIPDLVIGDMDSITEEVLSYYQKLTKVEIFPPQKNETDTELALNWCVEHDVDDILIINTLEGDFAHTMGIVALLFKAGELGIKARIFNFRELVFLIPPVWRFSGKGERKISLIPVSDVVTGVETSGLEYPLKKEDLFRHSTRGLSNVFIDGEIKICYKSGYLLVVMESNMEDLLWIKI